MSATYENAITASSSNFRNRQQLNIWLVIAATLEDANFDRIEISNNTQSGLNEYIYLFTTNLQIRFKSNYIILTNQDRRRIEISLSEMKRLFFRAKILIL